jgi:tetratricopeptide (TPR) repeat protein
MSAFVRLRGKSIEIGNMTMRHTTLVAIVAGAILAAIALRHAPADVVIFNSGAERRGVVQDYAADPDYVSLTDHVGTIRLQRSQIRQIVKEPAFMGHLAIGDGYLKNARYDDAMKSFEEAVRLGAPAAEAQERIEKTRQLMSSVQKEERSEAVRKIDDLIARAGALAEQQRFQEAEDAYSQAMAAHPTPGQGKLVSERLIQLHLEWGKERVDRIDRAGAVEHFQKVLALDPDNEIARRFLIEAYKDDPARRDEVADYYEGALLKDPENLNLLVEAANAQFVREAYDKALPHYLRSTRRPRPRTSPRAWRPATNGFTSRRPTGATTHRPAASITITRSCSRTSPPSRCTITTTS